MQEKQLALGRVRGQAGVNVALIHRALEGRVHQDYIVLALIVERLRERIHIKKLRRLDPVQHQIHGTDPEHGHPRIVIEGPQVFLRRHEIALFLGQLVAD